MSVKTFKCERIASGKASGPALVSNEAICFYLVEPETGIVVEQNHSLAGRSMDGTVLVAHAGKGSSVVQMDGLFKLAMKHKNPLAVILRNPDPVFVSALLVMEIPSVFNAEEAFYGCVKDGDRITVDADNGIISLESLQ
jgi:predicted aconitase with swiveling domain